MFAHERPGVDVVTVEHDGLGRVPHLRVPWSAYFTMMDELIVRIARATFQPNQIIAIAFGGIVPARAIGQALDVPLAYFAAESYAPVGGHDATPMVADAHIRFDRHLLRTRPGLGTRVLVVDDLVDNGRTMQTCVAWLRACPEFAGTDLEIATAVLWHKRTSRVEPDFAVDHVHALPPDPLRPTETVMPWIDQPMETMFSQPLDVIRNRTPQR